MNDLEKAIILLRDNGMPVEPQAYGFSLQHEGLEKGNFAECGMDNDSSISMSVHVDEDPPTVWFFRISFVEMAEFIRDAYMATGQSNPSGRKIISAMRRLDTSYDDTKLEELTTAFLSDIEYGDA